MTGTREIIYVSSIPWSGSWHRQQDMMSYMAGHGYRVLYIEPSSKKHPFHIVFEKKTENLWILRPMGLPYERCLRSVNRINSLLSRRETDRALKSLGFQRPILWLDRVHGFDFRYYQENRYVIYDLIDEICAFGRIRNEKLLLGLENSVLTWADLLLSSSETLMERKIRQSNRTGESIFLPNGVDITRFPDGTEKSGENGRAPVLGFVGEISRRRLDYSLIAGIAGRRPDWKLIFTGPGNAADRDELRGLADNISVMDAVEGGEIPSILCGFDIGIIPYHTERSDMDYVFPRKALEYLAAGKPVISTPLKELKVLVPYVTEAQDAAEFVMKAEAALSDREITAGDRRKLAERFDWDHLMRELLSHLE